MAKMVNQSGGSLVMPDGTEVPDGGEVEVSADAQKNAGVAGWIERGRLVSPKKSDK